MAGLSNNALYMQWLAPSVGYVLGLTRKFCDTAFYRSLSVLSQVDQQVSRSFAILYKKMCAQIYTFEHTLPYTKAVPNCKHFWRVHTCRKQLQHADVDCCSCRCVAARFFYNLIVRCCQGVSRHLTDTPCHKMSVPGLERIPKIFWVFYQCCCASATHLCPSISIKCDRAQTPHP